MLESAAMGFLAGVVGGVLGAGLRVLHLEMQWHHLRADLKKYYGWMRNQRIFDIVKEANPKEPAKMDAAEVRRRYNVMQGRQGE